MAEEIILEAIREAVQRRRSLNIRKGVMPAHLLEMGVPYSRSRLYDFFRYLTERGELTKIGQRGGYVPTSDLAIA